MPSAIRDAISTLSPGPSARTASSAGIMFRAIAWQTSRNRLANGYGLGGRSVPLHLHTFLYAGMVISLLPR